MNPQVSRSVQPRTERTSESAVNPEVSRRGEGSPEETMAGGVNPMVSSVDGRPYAEVELLGERFAALVDTGANLNLIGDRVIELLQKRRVNPRTKRAILRMADGSSCMVSDYTG